MRSPVRRFLEAPRTALGRPAVLGAWDHDRGTRGRPHVQGSGGQQRMRARQQIGRRTWLAWMAAGTWALWSELAYERGRTGWRIALGGADLATRVAQAQTRDPVHALRVLTDFVSAYVLVRGKDIALVDTGLPNNGATCAATITTAGLGWEAVGHVILTHSHPDYVGSMGEVLAAAPQARVYAGAADISPITSPRPLTPVTGGEEVFGFQIH